MHSIHGNVYLPNSYGSREIEELRSDQGDSAEQKVGGRNSFCQELDAKTFGKRHHSIYNNDTLHSQNISMM